jgi:hypothetical protein
MQKFKFLLPVLLIVFGHFSSFAQCITTTTATITATADNQIIENKDINVSGLAMLPDSTFPVGIIVNGKSNVIIRNCRIRYRSKGAGIRFTNAPNITIERCEISLTNAPASGPLAKYTNVSVAELDRFSSSICIDGYNSFNPTIRKVKLTNGSAGIFLGLCNDAIIHEVDGYNFKGIQGDSMNCCNVNPRGQFIQFDKCRGGIISDFYCLNGTTSNTNFTPSATNFTTYFSEDNINFFKSSGQSVINGTIVGNNSPTGDGIIWEQQDPSTENGQPVFNGYGGIISNVDFIRMGNGPVGVISSKYVTVSNVYIRETHCTGVGGRPAPASGGLPFWGGSGADLASKLYLIDARILNTTAFPNCYAPQGTPYQPNSGVFTVKKNGSVIADPSAGNNYQTNIFDVTSTTTRPIYQNTFSWTVCPIANGNLENTDFNPVLQSDENIDGLQTIYPNPATSSIRIDGLKNEEYQIVIQDIQGVAKIQRTISSNSDIPVDNLAEGIYFVLIMQNDKIVSQKKLVKANGR